MRLRNHKPLLALLCVAALLAASCGGDADDDATVDDETFEPSSAAAETVEPSDTPTCQTPPPLTEEDVREPSDDALKAAFIYVSPVGDAGWSWAHNQGRLFAAANTDVETAFSESIPESDADFREAVEVHIANDADIIFGTSFGYMDTMEAMAAEYPEVTFEHASGYKGNDTNFGNYFGRIYQPRYLAGVVAGSLPGIERIGYVAAYPIPEVIRGINAFTLGVQSLRPNAVVDVRWTSTWFDPSVEADAANALIEAGAQLLTQHQDSPSVGTVAESRGVRWVPYHSDMCNFAPTAYVTSAVWDWGPYYQRTIEAIADGSWEPGNYWGGMEDDIVGLAPLAEDVGNRARQLIDEVAASIRDGSFDPFDGEIKNQDDEVVKDAGERMSDADLLSMNYFVKGVVGSPSS